MTDNRIRRIATEFRLAIEKARDEHQFDDDECFRFFPTDCCGLTCSLLAKHLADYYSVETLWISTTRRYNSHAWLVIKDSRITVPSVSNPYPDDIAGILMDYNGGNTINQKPVYRKEDIAGGLIIDITADQFDDFSESVYVGYIDDFHNSFDFINATEYSDICDEELLKIYRIIESVITAES